MLYQGLSLLAGALIGVMVACNGWLAGHVGQWMSLIIIHICGLLTAIIALLLRRQRFSLRAEGVPWYLYLAGVGGVYTTLINNICFAPLGAASMLAMTVVGQLLCSSLIDHFGWFGLQRYPFRRGKIVGFAFMAAGLVVMTLF